VTRPASTLYFDCFSGASGDMILGALVDAGLPIGELRAALGAMSVDGLDLRVDRVVRAGVSAAKFRLVGVSQSHGDGACGSTSIEEHAGRFHAQGHAHPHVHDHHHLPAPDADQAATHAHHSLLEIARLIDRSGLSPEGKDRARGLFERLAKVEASIHQMPIEQVHLHEVGALDSIVDIVGAVFGLDWFGADDVVVSPLNVGGGTVQCTHGRYPVPAPATARLLEGVPVYSSGVDAELVTPTGALVLTGYARAFGPLPPMTVRRIGYGAGDREIPGAPNVLRVYVGETAARAATERILVVACEIDDMNPQIFGALMDRLFDAGALDVFYTPIQMKKSRPGTLVTVLAFPDRREALASVLFRETTTLGVRYEEVHRERLARESVTVETPAGPVRMKIGRRGDLVMNASPEFEDCARLAAARSLSIKDVQAMAVKAYLDRGART
jgi:uncharacterized protein (TIGR00299 family) protein